MRLHARARTRQRAFTLIEVLVAMTILGIGLLGAASMLTDSLRLTSEARHRSQAARLGANLVAAIRADRDALADYVGLGTLTQLAALMASDCVEDAVPPVPPANATELLVCWVKELDETLPAASASLITNTTSANYVDVTIAWLDREDRDYGGNELDLASDQDECEDRNTGTSILRLWLGSVADTETEACLIVQRWSVRI